MTRPGLTRIGDVFAIASDRVRGKARDDSFSETEWRKITAKEGARTKAPFDEVTWRRVMGVQLAKRTRPHQIRKGVLWVRVETSAWAQELSLMANMLLAKVKRFRPEVTEIRFRVGPLEPEARPPELSVAGRTIKPAPIPEKLAVELVHVDDDVRNAIMNAAAANLAWQGAIAATRITSRQLGVRVPQSAEAKSVQQDRTPQSYRGASQRTGGSESG